jgi:hypothetical protein
MHCLANVKCHFVEPLSCVILSLQFKKDHVSNDLSTVQYFDCQCFFVFCFCFFNIANKKEVNNLFLNLVIGGCTVGKTMDYHRS